MSFKIIKILIGIFNNFLELTINFLYYLSSLFLDDQLVIVYQYIYIVNIAFVASIIFNIRILKLILKKLL